MNTTIFNALFVIVPIFVLVIFIFTIMMMISPKLRGKLMSRQVKATRYMMEASKDDLKEMGTMAGDIQAQTKKKILDQNEDVLKLMKILNSVKNVERNNNFVISKKMEVGK